MQKERKLRHMHSIALGICSAKTGINIKLFFAKHTDNDGIF